MPIKIFKFKNKDNIEDIINKWEKDNKIKIDSITIDQSSLYFNVPKTAINDIEHMIIINYHKRRIRKPKNEVNN